MKPQKTEYDVQAESFAASHGVAMAALYLGHFPRLGDWATSQWQVTLTRQGRKPFVFTFSQSINESWQYREQYPDRFKWSKGLPPRLSHKSYPTTGEAFNAWQYLCEPVKIAPTIYSILACLTKSDPGYFEEFCADYGYDDDSITARDTWQAVVKEWREVERLFGDCLEELQEIN